MAFFNISELIDIVIMTAVLGYVFKDFFGTRYALPGDKRRMAEDPVAYYRRLGKKQAVSAGFKSAVLVVAPAIILHEMGHKITAMSMGFNAEFHAAYFWLAIALLLKLMNVGFIFFVPAYVSISGAMTPGQSAATAFAGPGVNLLLALLSYLILKNKSFAKSKKMRQYLPLVYLSAKLNLLLFVFNMLPIPMFDGWQVYMGIFHAIAG